MNTPSYRGEYVMGETVKGAARGSILGGFTGALVGLATAAINPVSWAFALGGAIIGGLAFGAPVAGALILGAGGSMLMGAGIGAGIGSAAMGAKGAFSGRRMADEAEVIHARQIENYRSMQAGRQNQIAAAAIEQAGPAIYQTGVQEGVAMTMSHIQRVQAEQQAQLARHAAGEAKGAGHAHGHEHLKKDITPEGIAESKAQQTPGQVMH